MITNTWLVTGTLVPVVWAGCKYGGLYDTYLDLQEAWHQRMVDKRYEHYERQDNEQRLRDLQLWREYKTGELEKRLKMYSEKTDALAKMGYWAVIFGGKTHREMVQEEEAKSKGKRAPWGTWGGQGPLQ